MATQLFFQHISTSGPTTGVHRGTNSAKLTGATTGWVAEPLLSTRGTAQTGANVNTVTGPTNGLEVQITPPWGGSPLPLEWISMPLAAATTIAGTITLNLWAFEATMNDNVAINAIVERLDVTGAIVSQIAKTARVTEEAVTTAAAANFTVAPTSTNMLKGERLRVRVFADDAGTMGSGGAATFSFSGPTAAANGDSYITFTETFSFLTTEPVGSILYLTTTTGPAVGTADEREMWTSRGGASTSAVVNTVVGWTAPIQWTTAASSSLIEWYSRTLTAFTLDGLVRINVRAAVSAVLVAGVRAELAVTNGDGSGAVVWAAADIIDSATPGGTVGATAYSYGDGSITASETVVRGWLAGQAQAVTAGQRLRLRLFIDDSADQPMGASVGTATLTYNGPTASASGDSWIQLPQSVTETTPPAITQAAYQFFDATGTEAGASSLAAVNTNPGVNVTAGDGAVALRIRLQSTSAIAIAATDDFQLQVNMNSGGWANVTASSFYAKALDATNLTDGAATTNRLGAGTGSFVAGKVSEDGLADDVGWAGNNYTELLYALTLSASDLTNGNVLTFQVLYNGATTVMTYTQTPTITVTKVNVAISQAAYQFFDDAGTETGAASLAAVNTAITANTANGDQAGVLRVRMQLTTAAPTKSTDDWQLQWEKNGNGTWTSVATTGNTVLGYDNPNLTDGAATTNRMGAGTGSFVAGEIAETGSVIDFGWSASNYTELVYSVKLLASNFTNGDTLRFRVLYNGATTFMTYTQVPTINVSRIIVTITATVSTTWNTTAQVTAATRATTWNTAASVTPATRLTTWTVRTPVTPATRLTTWTVTTPVTPATRLTTWNALARISSATTRLTTWNVLAPVTAATRATTWTVRTPVTPATRLTTWTTQAAITPAATRATTWATKFAVTSTRLTTWNVAAPSGGATTSIVGTTTASGFITAGGSLTVNKPTGSASGDRAYLFLTLGGRADQVTVPSGFVTLTHDRPSNYYTVGAWVFRRTLDGAEGSTFTLSWPGVTDDVNACVTCVTVRGVGDELVGTYQKTMDTGTTGPCNIPDQTIPTGGIEFIYAAALSGFSEPVQPMSGWVTTDDVQGATLFSRTTAGATGVVPVMFTNAEAWMGVSLLLGPVGWTPPTTTALTIVDSKQLALVGSAVSAAVARPVCAPGDTLVWIIGYSAGGGGGTAPVPASSAGTWTFVGRVEQAGYLNGLAIYTHTATSNEPQSFFTTGPGATEQTFAILSLRNAGAVALGTGVLGAGDANPITIPGVAVPAGGMGFAVATSLNGYTNSNAPSSGPWETLYDFNPSILTRYTGTGTSPSVVIPNTGSSYNQGMQFSVAVAVAATVPQNVVATPTGKTTITVTWDAFATATSYDIERNGAVVATAYAASPYLDTGLTPGTLYTYRVRAELP